jgi:hypothetical protein
VIKRARREARGVVEVEAIAVDLVFQRVARKDAKRGIDAV